MRWKIQRRTGGRPNATRSRSGFAAKRLTPWTEACATRSHEVRASPLNKPCAAWLIKLSSSFVSMRPGFCTVHAVHVPAFLHDVLQSSLAVTENLVVRCSARISVSHFRSSRRKAAVFIGPHCFQLLSCDGSFTGVRWNHTGRLGQLSGCVCGLLTERDKIEKRICAKASGSVDRSFPRSRPSRAPSPYLTLPFETPPSLWWPQETSTHFTSIPEEDPDVEHVTSVE